MGTFHIFFMQYNLIFHYIYILSNAYIIQSALIWRILGKIIWRKIYFIVVTILVTLIHLETHRLQKCLNLTPTSIVDPVAGVQPQLRIVRPGRFTANNGNLQIYTMHCNILFVLSVQFSQLIRHFQLSFVNTYFNFAEKNVSRTV